jgi:hypothetical protein
MDLGCLCQKCFEMIVDDMCINSAKIIIKHKASIAHQCPMIEIPWIHENGNTYYESCDAVVNFCCQCGRGI